MALPHLPPQDADTALSARQLRRRRRRISATQVLPKLSVVIVNYHHWQGTAQLARRILSTPAGRRGLVEVVVVDNHSPRHRLIGRLRRWPGVSLRRWRHNRGFARAANEGCRLSRGDWLLLLNPDVSLPDDFIERVLSLGDELTATDARAGVIGFGLRNSDGSPQWSAGPWPTLAGTLGGLLMPRGNRKCRPLWSAHRCRVPWVTGCCLLLRRDCWRQLAGFDEDFFLYYEDVDFCRRARDAGWSVWFEPTLHAIHHRPLHVREVTPPIRLSTRHALLTYAAKHWPAWQTRLLGRIVGIEGQVRQWWAARQRNAAAQDVFRQLTAMARDFLHDRPTAARRRVDRTFRKLD